MLTFLRKNRKSSLQSSTTEPAGRSVGRYLFYAIGEIVLVVVGILIALALNGARQSAIDAENEQFYLANLMENLNEDKAEILRIIAFQNERRTVRTALYDLLDSEDLQKNKIDSIYRISAQMNFTFFHNPSAFNSLKSSGSFALIENKQLQIELSNLYEKIYYRIDYNGEIYDRRLESTAIEVKDHYDWDKMSFIDWSIVENNQLKNIIAFEQDYNRYYVGLLEDALEKIDELLLLIENELVTRE